MSKGIAAGLVQRHARWAVRQTPGNANIIPAKTIGAAGEQLFYSRALRQGFDVSIPLGDNSPYDCLIDTGSNIHRVQIKTASKPGRKSYGFSLQSGATKAAYPDGTLDFFALICLDLDLIYIVPIEELIGRESASIYANVESNSSRLEKYREAWGQLNLGTKKPPSQ